MTTEAEFYDQAELWGQAPEPYQEHARQDLLDLLPAKAASVLDVGCGDGFITNALPARVRAAGVDVSRSALRHVRVPAALGSITALPFAAGAFDLVMANDTLEHIPAAGYDAARAEMARVARHYLLVTVPFMENLPGAQTRCARCGTAFHVNHHQRAYGTVELTGLFGPEWRPRAFVFSGAAPNPVEQAQRGLAAYLGLPVGWERAVCPLCGARRAAVFLDAGRQAEINALAWELRLETAVAHWPSRSECLVLFERCAEPEAAETFSGLRLVAARAGESVVVPGTAVPQAQHLVLETDADVCADPNTLRLEYDLESCLYRLPRPECLEAGRVIVPVWFSPRLCQSLSPQAFTDQLRPLWLVSAALQQAESARGLRLQAQALDAELQQARLQAQTRQAHLDTAQAQLAAELQAERQARAQALADQAAVWQQALEAERAAFAQYRVRWHELARRGLAIALAAALVMLVWLVWLSAR